MHNCVRMKSPSNKEETHIPEFTKRELQTAIDCLKKGKNQETGDTKGMKAEDIKGCDDETKELMRDIFNEIIKQESMAH